MICKYCGASYADNLLNCPFCRTENPLEAEKQKKSIFKKYDREADAIREEVAHYPRKAASVFTRKFLIGIAAAVVLAALIAVLCIVLVRKSSQVSYNKHLDHEAVMNEYLDNADYESMVQYLDSLEKPTDYDKYYQVKRLYDAYADTIELDASLREKRTDIPYDVWLDGAEFYVGRQMVQAHFVFYYYDLYKDNSGFIGNKKALDEIYQWTVDRFKGYGLEDAELVAIRLDEDPEELRAIKEKLIKYYWQEVNQKEDNE